METYNLNAECSSLNCPMEQYWTTAYHNNFRLILILPDKSIVLVVKVILYRMQVCVKSAEQNAGYRGLQVEEAAEQNAGYRGLQVEESAEQNAGYRSLQVQWTLVNPDRVNPKPRKYEVQNQLINN